MQGDVNRKNKSKSHSFSVFLVHSDRYLCSDLIHKRRKRVYIVPERNNCILTTVYCKLVALVKINVPHRLTAFSSRYANGEFATFPVQSLLLFASNSEIFPVVKF